ncbi:S-layer homology domain-containing protein [Intestinimonas butyriciproducens]|nr:S-layer homology domain-containing protein [Intestinimonas butyriciproducens]
MAGSPEPITSINAFSHLSSLSTQERKAIRRAVEENIANGTSITTFSPSMVLTRAQVFTFLYRYYN